MLDIRDVFSNLLELFLLIGVGYGAVRLHMLPASASKIFSSLVMNITLPATILTSLVQPYDPAFLNTGLLTIALGFGLYILYGVISALLVRPCRVPQGRRGVWIFACTFNNNGFMGFPITLALFGQEGLVLAVFLGISFNVLSYSTGAKLMCMDRAAAEGGMQVSWKSILLTVVNGATVLGLVLYAAQLSLPALLEVPLTYLADITTPVSMLAIGMNLTGGKVSAVFRNRDAFTASLLRLLGLPLLTWGILMLLPIHNDLLIGVVLIIMAMPAPAVTSILAETYGGDTEFAAQVVFLSSLLCLVTIPLISLLL